LEDKIFLLPNADSRKAADQSYLDAAVRLCDGLEAVVNRDRDSDKTRGGRIYSAWIQSTGMMHVN
jgi:hypothetical protein